MICLYTSLLKNHRAKRRACTAWPGKISDTGNVACDFALDVATLDYYRCNAASLQMQGPIVETEDLTKHQQKDWENLL